MACLFMDKDNKLELRFRFRYYTEDDPWAESDTKNSYRMAVTGANKDEAITYCDGLFLEKAKEFGYEFTDFIDINSNDPDVIMGMMGERPWCHVRKEPAVDRNLN
jgi:hypothetical protein